MNNKKSIWKFAFFSVFEYNLICNLHINVLSMKKYIKIMLFLLAMFWVYSFSYAQQWKWTDWWSTPFQVLESVVDEANAWSDKIQRTALDNVSDLEWTFARQYKISNTLDYIRMHISPYIQRAVYIWFVASTAWLIICGFLMVTWWISKSSWFEKVKWRVINALLWVFMLSGFYIVIKFMMSIINYFFSS